MAEIEEDSKSARKGERHYPTSRQLMDPPIYQIEQVSPKYTKNIFQEKNQSNGSSFLSDHSLKSSSF